MLRIPTDEELAAAAREGNADAYSLLVSRYATRLFNFLRRRARTEADAEDLAQETFIRAWTKLHTYRPGMRFSTWLYTIGTRLAATHARTRRLPEVGPPAVEPADPRNSAPADGPDPLAVALWSAADRVLPPEQRSAVWLRYAEDLAVGEIARVLGKSRVNVRVMLFRARRTLAAELARIESGGKDAST
ncbi:MAG: sigma-70 family RNA polymerase sigma factor [Phycisphaeraceae bacterium]|nr:sigma-70 family RNA polymerase sigma factor [Phycisphaeraceae bacterium]